MANKKSSKPNTVVTKRVAAPKKASNNLTVVPPKTKAKSAPSATAVPELAASETASKPIISTPWYQKAFRVVGRFTLHSSVPEILLVATLCMSRYLQNSDFSYPSEIVINIVLLGIIVSFVFYVFRLALRSLRAAHIAGLFMAYGLYGFDYTFPRFHRWGDRFIPKNASSFTHAMLEVLFLAIIFSVIAVAVDRLLRLQQLSRVPLLKIMVFAVCFIFIAEVEKMGSRMWTIRKDLFYKEPTSSLQQSAGKTASNAKKPDVYYLLFDRYANATTLSKDYNYDNSSLLSYLGSQGFVTRDNAYANYPFTMQSVSSTLAAGYHTQINKEFQNDAKGFQTAFPYRTILDNSPVTQAFQSAGYNYNQLSSWWDFTRNTPGADDQPTDSFRLRLLGKNFWMTDLQRDIVNKSILSPLLLKGLTIGHTTVAQYQLDRNPTQNFDVQMNAIKSIANASATESKPQFTFAHILSPHDPYIFDANCNTPDYDDNRTDKGVDEDTKYTAQLTCDNKNITDIVGTIRSKDPTAVVVLQADEGPYPKQFRGTLTPGHYYDPTTLPLQQMQQKFGVLASYYMPNTTSQTVGKNITSSVNTFRFVLNNYLGYTLPVLPDCQFSSDDKYNLYTYQLVSGELNGTAEPKACNIYK